MSCINCGNKNTGSSGEYSCLCDQFVHPLPLHIGAGLSSLPRQIATFPEFRRAMLQTLKSTEVELIDKNNTWVKLKPLDNWRARDKDDFGIMLLEMWAYICDSLSFYDNVIANETYLRTSRRRTDVRRLVALLGYLPRPAVGSMVKLAAVADGRLQLRLPPGTAFRSGAFDGNPPQVFELDKEAFIHPLNNHWKILSPHPGLIISNNPDSLLVLPVSQIKEEAVLLLINSNDYHQNQGLVVKKVEKHTGIDQEQYIRLSFTSATKLPAGASLSGLKLLKSTQSTTLWTGGAVEPAVSGKDATIPHVGGSILTGIKESTDDLAVLNPLDVSGHTKQLTLKNLVPQIKAGSLILVAYADEARWFWVIRNIEVNGQPFPSGEITVNGTKFSVPPSTNPLTQLVLDVNVNSLERRAGAPAWSDGIRDEIIVYYGLQKAASIIDEPKSTLSSSDPLYFDGFVEAPVGNISPKEFLLQDKNTFGAAFGGNVDYDAKKMIPDQGATWNPELTLPVEAFGNVITASRGEKVSNEIMGGGDASIPNQTFKLKKKPLTYHLSPTAGNDNGVSNSLVVYVNGIKWTEVNSFYGKRDNDPVYIVRQNDKQDSLITFGDGIRGQRLPSGIDNVVGSYRFGAEEAGPPAGSVNQISKPVKGLQSVKNILSAFGGANAEPPESLRMYAPKSALILGRVVSLKDMEALAGAFPGVRAVQTEWRWNHIKQSASAHIYYIGEDGLAASLSQRIRNVADPSVSITIEKAQADPRSISLNIEIDPRFLEADVIGQLRLALMSKQTGLLAPENIGIGQPLYRSRIFSAVFKITGTIAVESILWNGDNFEEFAATPGAGRYFNIEQGKLILNGKEN